MNSVRRTILAMMGIFVVCNPMTGVALDQDDAEIIGLKLGMTVEEAKQAIADYDADLIIQPPMQRAYRYQVGNKTLKTDPFISSLYAVAKDKQKGNVQLYFSMPPSEAKVIAISRTHSKFEPPITRDNYIKALVDKYGEPDATQKDVYGDSARQMHWLQWHISADKQQCLPYFSGGREADGSFGTVGGSSIEKAEVTQVILSKHPNAAGLDLDNCASVLTYQLNYDPVFAATGFLVDVSAAIKSEREVNQWIDSLVKQEEAKNNSSTAKPKL